MTDLIDLSQHVETDPVDLQHIGDFFCRKQVLSKIEAVEYRKRQTRILFLAADRKAISLL